MPVIQNISLPAGDNADITFNIDGTNVIDLNGATIYWRVFDHVWGIPEGAAVLSKATDALAIDDTIEIPGSPADVFVVPIRADDTKGMLGNYYHEAIVIDVAGNPYTVTTGMFTVTQTKIASAL